MSQGNTHNFTISQKHASGTEGNSRSSTFDKQGQESVSRQSIPSVSTAKEKSPFKVGNLKMKIVKYTKAVDAAEKEPTGSTNGTNTNGQKILKIRKTKMNLVSSNIMGNGTNGAVPKDQVQAFKTVPEEDFGSNRVFYSNMNTSTTME